MYDGERRPEQADAPLEFAQHSDERLVELCQRQTSAAAAAFQALVERHRQRIYSICLKYLQREEDASDACQEVFVRVYLYLEKFEGRSSFGHWLSRIARNQCYSMSAQQTHPIYHSDIEADSIPTLDTIADTIAVQIDMDKVLRQLSQTDRQILQLRYFTENSMEEIAAKLQIQLSAAKMRVLRAKQRFKTIHAMLDQ